MNYRDAIEAIKGRLNSLWTRTPIFPGNDPTEPPDTPFLKVWARGQMGRPIEVSGGNPNGRSVEYEASLRLVLFVPKATDELIRIDLETEIDRLFSLAEIGAGDERISCRVVEIGSPAPADDAGAWESVTIRVPFRYFGRAGGAA